MESIVCEFEGQNIAYSRTPQRNFGDSCEVCHLADCNNSIMNECYLICSWMPNICVQSDPSRRSIVVLHDNNNAMINVRLSFSARLNYVVIRTCAICLLPVIQAVESVPSLRHVELVRSRVIRQLRELFECDGNLVFRVSVVNPLQKNKHQICDFHLFVVDIGNRFAYSSIRSISSSVEFFCQFVVSTMRWQPSCSQRIVFAPQCTSFCRSFATITSLWFHLWGLRDGVLKVDACERP